MGSLHEIITVAKNGPITGDKQFILFLPQHTYLYSSPTVSEIRDCFSNDTVPCHVISAMLRNSHAFSFKAPARRRCVQ